MLPDYIYILIMLQGMGSAASDGTKLTHLNQGVAAQSNQALFKKLTAQRLPFLEDTSAPNLASINLEGMADRISAIQESRPLSKNERKFNELLHLYEVKYQQITQEFLKQPSDTSAEKKAQLQFDLNCINNSLMEVAGMINAESQEDAYKVGAGALRDALTSQQSRVANLLREGFAPNDADERIRVMNLLGQAEDTGLKLQSNYYYYLVYIIVGATVALLTLHAISEDGSVEASGVILGLVLIYLFSKYVMRG